MQRLTRAALVAVTAGLLTACGGSNTRATTQATSTPAAAAAAPVVSGHLAVSIRKYMFGPMHVTVKAGTRVTFHNFDQTPHTATAIGGGFDSGTIAPGASATVVMRTPGTYRYRCLFHAFMLATITVVPG